MYILQNLTPQCGSLQSLPTHQHTATRCTDYTLWHHDVGACRSPARTLTYHYMGYGTPANWQTGRHCSLWDIYFTTALNPGWVLIFWAQRSWQWQFPLTSSHFPSWVFPTSGTHPACWTMVRRLLFLFVNEVLGSKPPPNLTFNPLLKTSLWELGIFFAYIFSLQLIYVFP